MASTATCPVCAAANPAGAMLCAVCGGRLTGDAPGVAEERKLVTVLFADIGGSLALIRGRDPEAARDLLAPVVARMAEAVAAHGGTVAQLLGDGIMALFGAPAAQEQHATAACLAALAIRDAIAGAASRPLVAVRIGLHSGEVLIERPPPGSGVLLQPTGEVVHIAARLQQTAAPNTAQASLATLQLAGARIQARALPARRLRGLAAPLAAVELLAAAEPGAPPPPPRTTLLGRAGECASLAGWLDASATAAQFVRLEGEAGAGKSRLAAWLVGRAGQAGMLVATLACQPHAETPLAPLRRLLRALPAASAPAADEDAAVALAQPEAAQGAAWRREEPALRRARMLAAAAARLRAASPLLVLVEDAHWLEPETAAALAALVALPPAPGLLVLATLRPGAEALPDAPPWRTLRLGPLSSEAGTELAARLLAETTAGLDPRMAERLVAQLAARAAGNPFFAEQIAAAWRDAGPGEGSAALPGRLRGVLAARIDRLAAAPKALLDVAAVLGEAAAPALLAAAAGITPDACAALLPGLTHAGMLAHGADGRVGFTHALLQDAVESALTRARRRALHAACLAALEATAADPAILLRHADGAGLPDATVRHARAAAQAAMAAYAPALAVQHLDQALVALDRQPDDAEVQRTRMAVLLALRDPLFRLGDIARIRAVLRDAAGLAAQLADRAGGAQIAILSSHAHWLAGDPVAAGIDAGRAAAIAEAEADPALALRATFQAGLADMATGALDAAARRMGEVAAALLDGRVPHGRFGLDDSLAATASGYRARALVELGALDAAAAAAAESETAAVRDGRPFARIFASLAAAAVAMAQARWEDAVARCAGAVEWCRAADARLMRPVALSLLGQAQLGAGDGPAARTALDEAVAAAEAMGFRIHQAQRLALLAEAELMCGETATSVARAARARALARRCGEQVSAVAAQRALALAGDPATARRGLAAAGRAAAALGLAPLAARCATEAARLPEAASARRVRA
jgi:class 3 adenylate cyclase